MHGMRIFSGLENDDIINFLDIEKGQSIMDLGGRDGFFSIKMLKYTNDITLLDRDDTYFHEVRRYGIKTIKADICSYSDKAYDLVFISNVYHDIKSECGDRALKNLGGIALKRIAVLDFKKEGSEFGPPKNIRLDKEEVEKDMQGIGFRLSKAMDLKFHYLLLFEREAKQD